MQIRFTLVDTSLAATLDDTEVGRAFAELLPLRLTLADYASTEKVSDLSQRLPTGDEPDGYDPEVGDITYFAPWGNLAVFYNDFGYAKGLVRLGRLEGGVERLATLHGEVDVVLELME